MAPVWACPSCWKLPASTSADGHPGRHPPGQTPPGTCFTVRFLPARHRLARRSPPRRNRSTGLSGRLAAWLHARACRTAPSRGNSAVSSAGSRSCCICTGSRSLHHPRSAQAALGQLAHAAPRLAAWLSKRAQRQAQLQIRIGQGLHGYSPRPPAPRAFWTAAWALANLPMYTIQRAGCGRASQTAS